jgi:hypothetical protein
MERSKLRLGNSFRDAHITRANYTEDTDKNIAFNDTSADGHPRSGAQATGSEEAGVAAAHSRSRAELLAQLQELPAKERLEHVAWDDFHPLAFFPASFAKLDNQTFEQLDAGTRKRLMEKLAARRKGAWEKLCEQLTKR